MGSHREAIEMCFVEEAKERDCVELEPAEEVARLAQEKPHSGRSSPDQEPGALEVTRSLLAV
jgi:hypothetical protein